MRVAFLGSPAFAVPSLRTLAASAHVVTVLTRPNRPAGRGRHIRPPAVKVEAERLGLSVFQPRSAKSDDVVRFLRDLDLDGILVVAYGEILPVSILELPRLGCLNLHASLLPRWRGAAPIPAAILGGDAVTGVTLIRMDQGMDTGPILAQASSPIGPTETSAELEPRLAELAASVMSENLPAWSEGRLASRPQPSEGATTAPRLRKDSGWLDFGKPASMLERQIRAYNPWPGSFFIVDASRVGVLRATVLPTAGGEPGVFEVRQGAPVVTTSHGALRLDSVQPAGSRSMTGAEFLRGAPHVVGVRLATKPRP